MTMSPAKNLLITGNPGTGKTTMLVWLARALSDHQPAGFITQEMREGGTRKGFLLVSCSGQKQVLSHVDIRSPVRVGKYGVDLAGFEYFLREISLEKKEPNLVIIDEIGKMECFSPLFRDLVLFLLASERPFFGTIGKNGTPFMESIKRRADVHLFELNVQGRESVRNNLLMSAISLLG